MPRNSAGAYSLPESPFVPSTPISSTAVNSDFDDVAAALTDSLSRTGDGGMQAVLQLNSAGFSYQGDSNTGMSRSAADTQVITCGSTDTIEITPTGINVTGTVDADAFTVGGLSLVLPIGVIFPYGGASAPTGYLLCDGTSYLRSAYPALFANIGAAFGSADSTHFNVPDLRGRVPAGKDGVAGRLTSATMTPDGNTLGATGGAQTEALTQANLPSGVTLTTSITDPGHTHTVGPSSLTSVSYTAGGTSTGNLQTTTATGSPASQTAASNTTGITASTALGGSGTAHVNVQPTLIVNYIIYAGA